MGIRAFSFAIVLALVAQPAMPASEIIANFVDMPIKTASGAPPSTTEVRDTIVNAASGVPARPWGVTEAGPGKLMARLQTGRRGHVVVVEIAYTPEKYSLQYRNSVHMNYRAADQTIHTSYNAWVRELVTHIDKAFGELRPNATTAAQSPTAVPTAAIVASSVSAAAGAAAGMPQPGDTWTYRATHIRRRGEAPVERPIRSHVIRIESVSESEVVDRVAVDGATPIETKHARGAYIVAQGVSVFSPYFGLWANLSQPGSTGGVDILQSSCDVRYACEASARIVGSENIRVTAGTFATTRIEVKQSWQPQGFFAGSLGGRTITLWYAPAVKRVVKYSSRATVGAYAPIDPHFDLELVSYQLK